MPLHGICNYPDIITLLGKPLQDFIRRMIYIYYFRKIILAIVLRNEEEEERGKSTQENY